MASDWIKMMTSLPDSPKILRISRAMGCDRFAALGRCMALWAWAGDYTASGVLVGLCEADLDARFGDGFSAALRAVGWLEGNQDRLVLPRWSDHNGSTAKRRALESRRQNRARKRHARNVTDAPHDPCKPSRGKRDEVRTKRREEKRREEHQGAALPDAAEAAASGGCGAAAVGSPEPVIVFASLDASERVCSSWNIGVAHARKAGIGDARFLQAALDDIQAGGWAGAEARSDPVGWLCRTICAYGESRESREAPTSLHRFLRDRKYTQPVEAWNFVQPIPDRERGGGGGGYSAADAEAWVRRARSAGEEAA